MAMPSSPVTPLVSIIMPVYNAGKTIQFALTSLIAQSYSNWECIVVDDGSADDSAEKAAAFRDARIRVILFEHNQGESAARQRALREAGGEYLGMLDADDWYYPDKLLSQVKVMRERPELSLVSCGMAIGDRSNDLTGIRSNGDGLARRYSKPGKVPVAHAPSVLRMAHIGELSFDIMQKVAADTDFLRRFLMGREYLVIPKVGYFYREIVTAKVSRVLRNYLYNIRGLLKFLRKYPLPVIFEVGMEFGKVLVYALLAPLGFLRFLIRNRSKLPEEKEREEFLRARATVEQIADESIDIEHDGLAKAEKTIGIS
jgi:glycosyltransferase involved in cell wall biosynthesis